MLFKSKDESISIIHTKSKELSIQSCKSGRAFRVELGFGPGLGLKLTKILG